MNDTTNKTAKTTTYEVVATFRSEFGKKFRARDKFSISSMDAVRGTCELSSRGKGLPETQRFNEAELAYAIANGSVRAL